jgi:acetylornithine deacetylase/succinyl-diaminopimelate desuccinylase-like protein
LIEAKELGLNAKLVGTEPERQNVLVEAGSGRKGFAFIGHMDTVSAGKNELWNFSPFEAEISGDRMYGRGTADNKAGLICGLYALALLADQGLIPPNGGRYVLAGVVDEESGASSPLGVRYLLDRGFLDVEAAIYTYASDVICIGHRGLLRLRVHAQGESVHSGSAEWDRGEKGVNAVTGLASFLLELETLGLDENPHPAFPGLSTKITPGTLISGGDWEGMVPGWAEAVIDLRLLPGQSLDEVRAAVQGIVEETIARRPGLAFEIVETTRLPGVAISEDHELVRLAKHFTHAITGSEWEAVGAGPANEGYMLIENGIPTLCGFGPTGGNPHAPDEWVDLTSLAPTIAMYCGIAIHYLASVKE